MTYKVCGIRLCWSVWSLHHGVKVLDFQIGSYLLNSQLVDQFWFTFVRSLWDMADLDLSFEGKVKVLIFQNSKSKYASPYMSLYICIYGDAYIHLCVCGCVCVCVCAIIFCKKSNKKHCMFAQSLLDFLEEKTVNLINSMFEGEKEKQK